MLHVTRKGMNCIVSCCWVAVAGAAFSDCREMCCAGVVQAGVQFTLFFALLYYLLAAEADPLLYAVRLLPLSDNGRQQAATALSDALRGVFLCALKVPFCHSIFRCFTKLYWRDCGPSLKASCHFITWSSTQSYG